MNPILQQLYDGEITPQESIFQAKTGEEPFRRWQERFAPLLHEHAPSLDAKFHVLMDDLKRIYNTDMEEMFYQGFGLAVKLITEALAH